MPRKVNGYGAEYAAHKVGKALGVVAVAGLAALEGAADGDGGHIERTRAGLGHAGIHELDVAGIGLHPRGVEVYLEVAGRFHGGLELQLLGGVRGGGIGHTVVVEQPAVVVGAVQVVVAREAEGKVPTRSEESALTALAEHLARFGHEAGECGGVDILIRGRHVAHEHQSARGVLQCLVPRQLSEVGTRRDGELHVGRIGAGEGDGVLVDDLVLHLVGAALLGARGHLDAFVLLSVLDGVGAVGDNLQLLGKLLKYDWSRKQNRDICPC